MESFLLLAKNARGAALTQLIMDVLRAPGIFVFAELIEMPHIQELKQSSSPYYQLLEIFAYGTYQDYKVSSGLPTLDDQQLSKLKKLSIVSLSNKNKMLQYNTLQHSLDIPNVRELEDLIIDAIFQSIIKGRLDQKNNVLRIDSTMGRDVRMEQIPVLRRILEDWHSNAKSIVKSLDEQILSIQNEIAGRNREKSEFEARLAKAETEAANTFRRNQSNGASEMDIDERKSRRAI